MGKTSLKEIFDVNYQFFNDLMRNINSYITPTFASFTGQQSHILNIYQKNINESFLKLYELNGLIEINFEIVELYLTELKNIVENMQTSFNSDKIDYFYDSIYQILMKIQEELNSSIEKIQLKRKIKLIDDSISDVLELKEQIKNNETHEIYALAAKENQKRSDNFRMAFIVLIVVAIIFIWFCAITKSYFGLKDYDYWFFKGTLVLTSVTLITYFLKQSVKYQKIADQCRQTKMELEAFPSFVASFATEDPKIIEIRRELALKYFGRELDSTTKDDTGGIIAEQMRSTTEMVKATTEAIKNLKGS